MFELKPEVQKLIQLAQAKIATDEPTHPEYLVDPLVISWTLLDNLKIFIEPSVVLEYIK